MLPSILAKQLEEGLSDYLISAYPMTSPGFKGSIEKMLAEKDSLFHKPYIGVRLPFRVAEEMPEGFFKALKLKYKPYSHQAKAFERLTGESGRSTVIATGTGSGKTECFLYPILEYCYQHKEEKGIKALIIYPMNALASDQAKRIAEIIYTNAELKGEVTAGMYVGGYEQTTSKAMALDTIITDHETMLSSPPDILLTNYKMLDYLLVRPKDALLWKKNNPETLKYIAVDELHTFDGAQGTDLACLLRRLKARLETPKGYICCIGTSATLGAKDGSEGILNYASEVFGEPFEKNAVITEDRLTSSEFFEGNELQDFTVPEKEDIKALNDAIKLDDQKLFLEKAVSAWLDESFVYNDILSDETRLALGNHLMGHAFTKELLAFMSNKFVQYEEACKGLGMTHPSFRDARSAEAAISALYALISHARSGAIGNIRPFLSVQVQFWLKELRRLLAKVSEDNITYAIASDLNEKQIASYLPAVNCHNCGETAWISLSDETNKIQITDLSAFYGQYFNTNSKVIMMYPNDHKETPYNMRPSFVCPNCMHLDFYQRERRDCPSCGTKQVSIMTPKNLLKAEGKGNGFKCPHCRNSAMTVIGLRGVTAVSASVSQLFSSKFNDDKKTLAFSDNVQDAAHRAGFFNWRSWRPSLRRAIQQFALDEGNGLSLQEFSSHFIKYWHNKLSNEEFVSMFIAPNMTWMKGFEDMKLSGSFGSGHMETTLMAGIEKRLAYEIMLEFGMQNNLGQSLQKSLCSVVSFPNEEISEVADVVFERAVNEIGGPKSQFSKRLFTKIIIGFLNLFVSNGAFNDECFKKYTINSGNAYLLSSAIENWLPGVQAGYNTPRFVYKRIAQSGRTISEFDTLNDNGIYCEWIHKCFGEPMYDGPKYSQIAETVIEELASKGLISLMPSKPEYKIWGLSKNKATISTKVKKLACKECGQTHYASIENASLWDSAPCIRSRCAESFHIKDEAGLGYYGKFYSSGDNVRITAKEHTGLLERDEREEMEKAFKRTGDQHKPWDTNLISCTPTLEMGIDIGDLSSVILCSIPPGQAQYIQRTGRAGRKDGNSLNIAVANSRPHDAYFYADPMEMMAGNIEPPKIFLKASALLERQFFAYSMDCWIKSGIPEKSIPDKISNCFTNLHTKDIDKYPSNFLSYVRKNTSGLLEAFVGLFPELDENEILSLERHAKGDGISESPMHLKIWEAFEALKKQKDSLNNSIKQLKIHIAALKAKPKDSSYESEIKELDNEVAALQNVIDGIDEKNVFNFLSDEGLLPNYAFPESGVVLKAQLYRKEGNTDKDTRPLRMYNREVYEYRRSASSALSEFAPDNSFYADGKKLEINQIDLTSSQVAKWRLCPNCSHAQLEGSGRGNGACPVCGSPKWADGGQSVNMLKLQMAYSNMEYFKSLIDDESDERQTTSYNKQLLVDVNEDEDISKAYRMDNKEFAFGYEFVRKATLREINFGERETSGMPLMVAGQESIRSGFKVCKYCGKVQPKESALEHAFACRARVNEGLAKEPYEENLFLYREFATEALRILIPATTMDSTRVRQESFIAAFMLGMKEYFGNVDHLRATISEVPVPESSFRKQYLVVYDSVPGGTGYLKQLMLKEHSLIEIFEKALAALERCQCKDDPQKDGCYHCLYAYRQSQNIGQISRASAIRLLKHILSGKENLHEIQKLGAIPVNGLFESELERLFIEAISYKGNRKANISIAKEIVHNKEGYLLKIGNAVWEIEPQVLLGAMDGITAETRADFVLWPSITDDSHKPVVIYTDGFLYHKDIVADDMFKREAVRRSGNFRVWTLSWKDVQSVFKQQGNYALETLNPGNMPYRDIYPRAIKKEEAEAVTPNDTPMELLSKYLELQNAEHVFEAHAVAYAFTLLDPNKTNNREKFDELNSAINGIKEKFRIEIPLLEFGQAYFGIWKPSANASHMTVYSIVGRADFKENDLKADILAFAVFDDQLENRAEKYEYEWNGFWHFYNIMQFLKSFVAVTSIGLENSIYDSAPYSAQEEPEAILIGSGWPEEMLSLLLDNDAKAFAAKCIENMIPPPSAIGYELQSEGGSVAGEAEMAWETEKIAFLMEWQLESKEAFLSQGWKVIISTDEIQTDWFKEGR